MASFTRKAIMDSCVRLLEERPVDKLTVKDIVEDCGINRNTFYYHFADLPSLISEILWEDVQRLIHDNLEVDSLWECLESILRFMQEHRRIALHLYHSNNRDSFEKQLFQICQYVASQYVDRACGDLPIKKDDKRIIIEAYKCECFGQIINWMNENMSEDCFKDLMRLCKLREGATKEMLLKSMKM